MSDPRPWTVGDEAQRWAGYLDERTWDPDIGQPVLRNLVGATSYDDLRILEDQFVEARALTMRGLGIPQSYDLAGLCEVHRHLFQDVYSWAGELRTVGLVKGEAAFAPPELIEPIVNEIGDTIRDSDNLRGMPSGQVPESLARLYAMTNLAHAFREGNGRTQREFIGALARESGHVVDWTKLPGPVNDRASEASRRGDLEPMRQAFAGIVSVDVDHDTNLAMLRGLHAAAYPQQPLPRGRAEPSVDTSPASSRYFRQPGRNSGDLDQGRD